MNSVRASPAKTRYAIAQPDRPRQAMATINWRMRMVMKALGYRGMCSLPAGRWAEYFDVAAGGGTAVVVVVGCCSISMIPFSVVMLSRLGAAASSIRREFTSTFFARKTRKRQNSRVKTSRATEAREIGKPMASYVLKILPVKDECSTLGGQ